jgi:hypothetical protein
MQKPNVGRVGTALQVAVMVAMLIAVAAMFAHSFRHMDPASLVSIVQSP